jgi:hypothetical protein
MLAYFLGGVVMEESWKRWAEPLWKEVVTQVWQKVVAQVWQDVLVGMENRMRELWEAVPDQKIVRRRWGWIISWKGRRVHLTVPDTEIAHITDETGRREKRWLPGISTHNVWWLGPSFAQSLFESYAQSAAPDEPANHFVRCQYG